MKSVIVPCAPGWEVISYILLDGKTLGALGEEVDRDPITAWIISEDGTSEPVWMGRCWDLPHDAIKQPDGTIWDKDLKFKSLPEWLVYKFHEKSGESKL